MDESKVLLDFGKRVKEIRIAKKMTQADLGFAAHLPASNISDIERGKSKIWLTTFIKIVEALQVSADSLLRSNVPEVNGLYKEEYTELLSDCTPAEIEAIMNIAKEVKANLKAPKTEEDY